MVAVPNHCKCILLHGLKAVAYDCFDWKATAMHLKICSALKICL